MEQLTLKAFAKINLCLDITGINSVGYHELDTIMQTVDLYDRVVVRLNDTGKISVECSDQSICGSDNIALRAAGLFFKEVNSGQGADIYIEKNIPLCGGLGGGSADAAAILNALNILFNKPLSTEKLLSIGLALGADVPFCIVGGTKRCKGIGQIIEDVPSFDGGCFVLINCGSKESTKQMYKNIDSTRNLIRPDVDVLVRGINDNDYDIITDNCKNVFSGCYDLSQIERDALSCGADVFCLSGSGSYGFALLENESKAESCKAQLFKKGYMPIVCKPTTEGFEIIK